MRTPKTRPKVDKQLADELRAPGADRRFGVNVIARPPATVRTLVRAVQAQLKQQEPGHYYYPDGDLHMTVFEICSDKTSAESKNIESLMKPRMESVAAVLRPVRVQRPKVRIDDAAIALAFSDGLEQLEMMREKIAAELRRLNIDFAPRYSSPSAHVTLMRYLQASAGRLRVDAVADVAWDINELWLTAGATWYGMRARIEQTGPFALS